jgi:hypothetical protein
MIGSLSFSLKAGTTTVRSTVLGSAKEGSGWGLENLRERYFFSEACVIIGGGDHHLRARYNCQ